MGPCRVTQTFLVVLLLTLRAAAQPGQGLADAPGLDGANGAPGRVEGVRAVGAFMQGEGRGKFQTPADTDEIVLDEYLVTFEADTSPSRVVAVARQLKAASADIEFKYLGNTRLGWKGLAFKVPPQAPEATAALLDSMLAFPDVKAAEANAFVKLYRPLAADSPSDNTRSLLQRGKPKNPPPPPPSSPLPPPPTDCPLVESSPVQDPAAAAGNAWGLDRIDTQAHLYDGKYSFSSADTSNVNVFVVDTGVQATHPELAGRVLLPGSGGFDYFTTGTGLDGNGHGTHCSGTIGGNTVGVAKNVNIVSVRVLDNSGSGTWDGVIAGIDFVAGSPLKNKTISMSLGGGRSTAVNDAVQRAHLAGVLVVVAAGNDNQDACNYCPASAPNAVTVGATDSNDAKASFSNWGSCVDIWGPGVSVYSSVPTNSYAYYSGTSMATPHVAGVVARLWSKGVCSNNVECTYVLTQCLPTPGNVTGAIGTAPNKLLYIPPGV